MSLFQLLCLLLVPLFGFLLLGGTGCRQSLVFRCLLLRQFLMLLVLFRGELRLLLLVLLIQFRVAGAGRSSRLVRLQFARVGGSSSFSPRAGVFFSMAVSGLFSAARRRRMIRGAGFFRSHHVPSAELSSLRGCS